VTAGILSASTFIAIVFPKIVSVLSIFGGVSAVLLAFVLPCLCFIGAAKGEPEISNFKINANIGIAVLTSGLGLGSLFVTVKSVIEGNAV